MADAACVAALAIAAAAAVLAKVLENAQRRIVHAAQGYPHVRT
jgi:hypothetical protein